MEEHLKRRPKKTLLPQRLQTALRDKAIDAIRSRFLPDNKIIRIVLIGSSVKGSFGQYKPPGFRGSMFSDFDFIIFVKDDYKILKWLDKEPTGNPFSDEKLNLTYRNRKFIDDKYDVEVFFVREKSMHDPKIQAEGETAGIHMTKDSRHCYLVVYP